MIEFQKAFFIKNFILSLKVALSRFNWCQNFVLRFFILSATKNLRRSKYSNFLLIKKLSVLVCANFWLQRGWKIGVQNFGTNWIEIKLPLRRILFFPHLLISLPGSPMVASMVYYLLSSLDMVFMWLVSLYMLCIYMRKILIENVSYS